MPGEYGEMDRLPPHNREAERCILGSMLRDNNIIPEIVQKVRADDFYVFGHQKIFEGIATLAVEEGKAADYITLGNWLTEKKFLEDAGGHAYLVDLWDAAPGSVGNARYYAEIVRQKAIVRNLIHACNDLSQQAYDQSLPATELLDAAERRIFEIAEMGITGDTKTLQDAIQEAYLRLDQRKQRGDAEYSGIPTGYVDLDSLTAGMQNSELIIVAARPSVGKCLAHDAEIVLEDGSVATIEEVYNRRQARLLTLGEDWRLAWTQPSAFVDDGVKPVYRVTTRLGRQVETTLTHPFLTIHGWRPLAEIGVGEHIAVPRIVAAFGRETLRACEIKLFAYLIGDGCLTKTCPGFTNGNVRLRQDFAAAVAEFGGVTVREDDRGGTRTASLYVASDSALLASNRSEFAQRLRDMIRVRQVPACRVAHAAGASAAALCMWQQGVCVPEQATFARLCAALEVEPSALAPDGWGRIAKNAPNPLTVRLIEVGLWGKGAREKFIPSAIFRLTRDQVALFLNRLFATDGWATVPALGNPQLGYATTSLRLGRQIQHLLLRFGIIASLRRRLIKYKAERRVGWQLDVTDQKSIRTFIRAIGIFGKEEALARVERAMEDRNYQTNRDLIPIAIGDRLAASKGDTSWCALARRAGLSSHTNIHVGKRALSRRRLAQFADALEDRALQDLAASDVYWDEIVSVEAVGMKQVYDLTIPSTHNFVANDVCVHNTAFALNVVRHICVEEGLPVLFVSLEQARVELAERLLCCQARVDSHRLRKGHLNPEEIEKLFEAGDVLSKAKLFIDDTPGQSMLRIAANARRLKLRHDLRMVVIDYLQLIDPDDRRDSRQEQVSAISRRLKFLARELNVPVIALAQVNRSSEDRQDHRPRLSDLRESGAIEQDADTVMLLHRPDYNEPGQQEGIIEIIIGKQRNGPTGDVTLMYVKQFMRFENFAVEGGFGVRG